tara:strand:- start:3896 stop:4153 length:258 start_codon:yes stop_codon:yes gene_type:complete
MNKDMIRRAVETLMGAIVDRNVEVNFSHLGKDTDYTYAIQTTLYEFDDTSVGPKGPLYLTLSSRLLQDANDLCSALKDVVMKVQD